MKNVQFFVLDEADRLLDGGFQNELDNIIRALPNRASHPRSVGDHTYIKLSS
jgi:superfamily II DNA/RNA helicase